MNLDREERHRRRYDAHQMQELATRFEGPSKRSQLLAEWKKRRFDNWNKCFANLPSGRMHRLIPEETVLESEYGLTIDYSEAIASGHFSMVHAGSLQSGQLASVEVAVKVARKSDLARGLVISDMDRQMSLLLHLQHPHLARVWQVFEVRSADRLLIVSQRARLGPLDQVVRRQGHVRENPLARKWSRDLLHAIDFLHNLGIAHRRIDPSHVLLFSPNHAAKLSAPDCLAEVTQVGKNSGSVRSEYSAPETVFGTLFDAISADVWSFGCTIFFMLTTRTPFRETTSLDSMKRQLNDKTWKKDPDLSPEAADFLSCILHGAVSKRATTTELLQTPWLQALLSRGSSSSTSTPSSSATSRSSETLAQTDAAAATQSPGGSAQQQESANNLPPSASLADALIHSLK